jgi:hypothetical protein
MNMGSHLLPIQYQYGPTLLVVNGQKKPPGASLKRRWIPSEPLSPETSLPRVNPVHGVLQRVALLGARQGYGVTSGGQARPAWPDDPRSIFRLSRGITLTTAADSNWSDP